MSLNILLTKLNKLITELNDNGKEQSANFFMQRYDVISECGDSIPDHLVKELSTCRAMAQYADFSIKEEQLLEAVVKSVSELFDKSNR